MTRRDPPTDRPARPGVSRSAKIGGIGIVLLGVFAWQGFAPPQEIQEVQERDCKLVGVGGYTQSRRQDSVHYRHHATGGIDYRCTDGTRIRADSAVVWEQSGNAAFFRNVRFEDADTELAADSARYYDNQGELVAHGNVVLTDRKGGAVIRGENLSYLNESRFRTEDRILVYGGSPRATIQPARRPAAPPAAAEPEGGGAGEEEGAPGDMEGEAPAADSLTGEVAAPAVAGPAGQAGDPAADSLAGEEEDPAADSLAGEEENPAADSLAGEPEDPAADSLAGEEERPAADSMTESAETEAETAPADAPVDSVTPLPYQVEATRIMIDGRRFFRAGGEVVVTRDSLRAVGDSLDYDQEVGAMLILGDASVEDSGFRLSGLSVSVTPAAGLNEEILAREEAELTGDEVLMTAPAIRLFLEDGKVGRLVALPAVPPIPDDGAEELDTAGLTPGDARRVREMAEAVAAAAAAEEDALDAPDSVPRPYVVAADFRLTGDSIEVLSPGQVLDVVTAVGAARGHAMDQDSLIHEGLPEIARNDWMEGETIIARFVPVEADEDGPAGDPGPAGGRARLETLTAVDGARSFYRLYRSDTTRIEANGAAVESDSAGNDPGAFQEEPPVGGDDSATIAEDPDAGGEDADPASAEEDGRIAEECDAIGTDDEPPPELHYVSGDQIKIFLEGRKVVKMEVAGRTTGYHFEPIPPDCESAEGDSSAAAGDTVTVPPDTTTIPPDTARST